MPTLTIEYQTDAERVQLERLIAYAAELNRLGATAARGTVLDACERFVLGDGRQLLRDTLADALQARADAEKNGRATAARGERPAP
jgi:hypothetical protein